MSTTPRTNPYYQHRVTTWCRILHGARMLDKDSLKLVGRFILSFFMLYLALQGVASATVAITGATITSGVDVAAFLEAVRIVQTEDNDKSERQA